MTEGGEKGFWEQKLCPLCTFGSDVDPWYVWSLLAKIHLGLSMRGRCSRICESVQCNLVALKRTAILRGRKSDDCENDRIVYVALREIASSERKCKFDKL